MKALMIASIALSILGAGAASAAEKKLKVADLPPAVEKTVKEQTKNATIVGLAKETEKGKTVYELETKVNGRSRDLMIDSAGAVLSVEEEVTLDSIPAAARAAIEKQAAGGKVARVETLTEGKTLRYEAAVVKKGKTSSITVTSDGSVVKGAALAWQGETGGWQSKFSVDKKNLSATGANQYFVLTPGFRLYYEHGKNTLTTTVLNETKVIDGAETRVVEDRETKNGQLAELTRDYYAIDRTTNDVYYFGEDVDTYRNGKVVGHEGAWLSGVKGARFGLMMPGQIQVGQMFYQEQAPGVGMDRAEVVAVRETVKTPAGVFENCVHMKETSALEKGMADHKWYAPGVGMVKEGEFVLVRIDKAS